VTHCGESVGLLGGCEFARGEQFLGFGEGGFVAELAEQVSTLSERSFCVGVAECSEAAALALEGVADPLQPGQWSGVTPERLG
jgi:hypothetical protein